MYRSLLKTANPKDANRIRKETIKTAPPTKKAFNKLGLNAIMNEEKLNYLQVF